MTKKELMDLVLSETELRNCDPAIPNDLYEKLREMGVEPYGRFVMLYTDNTVGGQLIDLFERFYNMYELIPVLMEAVDNILVNGKDRGDAYYDEGEEDYKEGKLIPEYLRLDNASTAIKRMIESYKQ